jgi:serine/threonine protein kinase
METSPRYRILDPIGRGRIGEIFLAEAIDPDTRPRQVAVALMDPRITEHAPSFQALQEQVDILERLAHPSIAQTIELAWFLEGWGLVMEYARGLDLELYRLAGAVPIRVVVEIIDQVAGALAAALELPLPGDERPLELAHGDLVPSLVRIDDKGGIKVCAFGLAAPEGPDPLFAAPEQHEGRAGPAADIYSLGLIVVRLLTGRDFQSPPRDPEQHRAFVVSIMDAVGEKVRADTPSSAHQAIEPVLLMIESMLDYRPTRRPAARRIQMGCRSMLGVLPGPWLHAWAEARVPEYYEKALEFAKMRDPAAVLIPTAATARGEEDEEPEQLPFFMDGAFLDDEEEDEPPLFEAAAVAIEPSPSSEPEQAEEDPEDDSEEPTGEQAEEPSVEEPDEDPEEPTGDEPEEDPEEPSDEDPEEDSEEPTGDEPEEDPEEPTGDEPEEDSEEQRVYGAAVVTIQPGAAPAASAGEPLEEDPERPTGEPPEEAGIVPLDVAQLEELAEEDIEDVSEHLIDEGAAVLSSGDEPELPAATAPAVAPVPAAPTPAPALGAKPAPAKERGMPWWPLIFFALALLGTIALYMNGLLGPSEPAPDLAPPTTQAGPEPGPAVAPEVAPPSPVEAAPEPPQPERDPPAPATAPAPRRAAPAPAPAPAAAPSPSPTPAAASEPVEAKPAPASKPAKAAPAPAPTEVEQSAPEPAPAPPPKEEPAPAPAPPPKAEAAAAPAGEGGFATISLEGDASKVMLQSGGESFSPGAVPAGTYSISAWFGGSAPVPAGTVTLVDGEAVTLRCSSLMLRCSRD